MKRRPISSQRRRGGTFTFIVLAVSVLILSTGTVLVDAVRGTHRQASSQTAQTRLREAAYAGVTWAARAHAAKDALRAGTLQLQGATVEVTYRDEAAGVRVTSIAKSPKQWARVDALLKPKGGALGIDTFEIYLVDPKNPNARAGKTARTAKTKTKTRIRRDF